MDAASVLMSPEFGAFGGLRVNQETALNGLKAQAAMAEIAGAPALQRQREAHARLYESQAAEHEESVASQKKMAAIMQSMQPGGGEGPATPERIAEDMLRVGEAAMKGGLLKQGADLTGKAVTILQHLASRDASTASADLRNQRVLREQLNRLGGYAMSGTQSQEGYDQARMALLNDPELMEMIQKRGIDLTKLPADYTKAKPALEALYNQTILAKDKIAQATRDRVADAEIAKDRAQAGAAGAAATASQERAKLTRLQVADIEKNGGDTTGGAREARKARREALRAAAEARRLAAEAEARRQASINAKRFLPAPQDPTKRTPNETYNTPRGPMKWTGQGWLPLVAPAAEVDNSDEDDEE